MKRQLAMASALLVSAFSGLASAATAQKAAPKPQTTARKPQTGAPKPQTAAPKPLSNAVKPLPAPKPLPDAPTDVRWKKTVIDAKFRAEGIAVADVNRDGKNDILVGDLWYEAPNWTPHEIRKPLNLGNGASSYSEAFFCWADDYNADGWSDLLVLGFPGKGPLWYENPQNKPGHWKEHAVWKSACNEVPIYVELFGDGKRYLVAASCEEGQMAWFEPKADAEWIKRPISLELKPGVEVWGVNKFDHGLGTGDMNGDGRTDVLVRQGWWEQPADAKTGTQPWKFHIGNMGDDCANIIPLDGNDDGNIDAITSSAHKRGIWFHKATPDKPGGFRRTVIFDAVTQTHALVSADINGDGQKDLITGKRWWAHGPANDTDPMADPALYWFEIKKTPGEIPKLVPHLIDKASGVGTQFEVTDVNGDKKLDIAVANKRGVFLFEQQ